MSHSVFFLFTVFSLFVYQMCSPVVSPEPEPVIEASMGAGMGNGCGTGMGNLVDHGCGCGVSCCGATQRDSPPTTPTTPFTPPTTSSFSTSPLMGHCYDGGKWNDMKLRKCANNESPAFNKNSRIAIVGGGPGGVTMAYLLGQRGFKNIVLFEKEAEVGGKAKTKFINGRPHELGACFLASHYQCVKNLVDQFGLNLAPSSVANSTVYDAQLNVSLPWSTWNGQKIFAQTGQNPVSVYVDAVLRYDQYWRATMGNGDYLFPTESSVNFTLLNTTFYQWLSERNLLPLFHVLDSLTVTIQGYGPVTSMSAYYGLLWTHPDILGSSICSNWPMKSSASVVEGAQTLFKKMVEASGAKVLLNASVTKVKRSRNNVKVTWNGRCQEDFDFLINASPFDSTRNSLDLSNEEKKIFDSITWSKTLSIHLFNETISRWPYSPENNAAINYNRTVLDLVAEGLVGFRNDQGIVDAWYPADPDNYITALMISPVNTTVTSDRARMFSNHYLRALGSTIPGPTRQVDNVHTSQSWNYFPQFSQDDLVNKRYPWRLWDLQGNDRTWHVGSSVVFESMNHILDYNLRLINEKLCTTGSDFSTYQSTFTPPPLNRLQQCLVQKGMPTEINPGV